ncbi:hypothetical protein NG798_24205 [Ancylothrix sp. C2]|uniref:hypothetical protein n=1 Tax=Ancylothrix sp. D3o TaxID=2953691 RepID=UPI0021BA6F60|nr:hypothetical protein [Ancylothrix sp. D3o]MCT7952907.1 hypothetical protein [Ancylothrix sp. D3o]
MAGEPLEAGVTQKELFIIMGISGRLKQNRDYRHPNRTAARYRILLAPKKPRRNSLFHRPQKT